MTEKHTRRNGYKHWFSLNFSNHTNTHNKELRWQ